MQAVDGLDVECPVDDERAVLRVDAVVRHAILPGEDGVGWWCSPLRSSRW